eukprot:1985751-Ditylum_brightwellii.AAC.1
MPHIMRLYPQIGISGINPEVVHEAREPKGLLFNYSVNTLLPIFKGLKTGKAAGPFVDMTNTLRDVAVKRQSLLHTTTNVQISWQYL